jgi:hypothetical protein
VTAAKIGRCANPAAPFQAIAIVTVAAATNLATGPRGEYFETGAVLSRLGGKTLKGQQR